MIIFDDVSLCLNNRTILKKISFEVNKGETALLVGSSGAGKSTILRLICGLLQPTGGSIWVMGQNLAQLSEYELNQLRKKLSLVFQNGALFDSLTLAENVSFFLREQHRLSEAEIQQRVEEIMDFFGLANFAHYYPAQISGGMKKRVSIARAIMTRPELLLYDEPTAGLDPFAAKKVVQMINDLRQNFHVTSLIVTHEIHHFEHVVDRLIMLKNATIHYDGQYDLSILDRFEETEAQLECIPDEEFYAEL
ncbi:MAG: ATP-binding cassette domain-containing protein [candidate division KSB1 bacterium]|nr:ATP-binding cassette domain-containing protein [candidate division KSB1 bacterium]